MVIKIILMRWFLFVNVTSDRQANINVFKANWNAAGKGDRKREQPVLESEQNCPEPLAFALKKHRGFPPPSYKVLKRAKITR